LKIQRFITLTCRHLFIY